MSNPKSDLISLDALLKSKGWKLIQKVMEDEILQAAMQIAENPNMTEKEVDFRRGAIWAAKQLREMPVRLHMKLTSEIALSPKDDSTSD